MSQSDIEKCDFEQTNQTKPPPPPPQQTNFFAMAAAVNAPVGFVPTVIRPARWVDPAPRPEHLVAPKRLHERAFLIIDPPLPWQEPEYLLPPRERHTCVPRALYPPRLPSDHWAFPFSAALPEIPATSASKLKEAEPPASLASIDQVLKGVSFWEEDTPSLGHRLKVKVRRL